MLRLQKLSYCEMGHAPSRQKVLHWQSSRNMLNEENL